MKKPIMTMTITQNDLSTIQQKILELGFEIASFRDALLVHQAKVRHVLLDSVKEEEKEILYNE